MAKFQIGNAGGPGRPKGSRSKARLGEFRAAIGEENLTEIVTKLTELAKEGDLAAIRVILDRLVPLADARQVEILERLDALEERLQPRAVA